MDLHDDGVGSEFLHRRTVTYDFEHTEETVTGHIRLHDQRLPRRPDADPSELFTVHDIALRVTARKSDRVIVDAEAGMSAYPHVECPVVVEHYRKLVGIHIGRGYNKKVQEEFRGVAGCAHLYEILRGLGPAFVQAMISNRAAERDTEDPESASQPTIGVLGNCHVWAEDGVAVRKLAAGWRPAGDDYPVGPVEEIEAGNREEGLSRP